MRTVIQPSFSAGEISPSVYGRVDMAKYHAALATCSNFFVDYRGGVSTRAGTKYILPAKDSSKPVRLIRFQAAFDSGYVLEFGHLYMRPFYHGSPVLETGLNITGATKANPCVVSVVNSYVIGDWVYITGVSGMTQLNGNYYIVGAATGTSITLHDLDGNNVDSTGFSTWTSGGTVSRVYTISTPYAGDDVFGLKFAQDVTTMVLTHTSYVPYQLNLVTATNWSLSAIVFGSSVATPGAPTVTTTLSAGTVNYAYLITAIDPNGQESAPSAYGALANVQDLRTTTGTNTISWSLVSGAVSYNVYKAGVSISSAVPAGSLFGFIGNVSGASLKDSNITPDFTITPPVVRNPFTTGSAVIATHVTANGSYTSIPSITFSTSPTGYTATGYPLFGATSITVASAGTGYTIGDILALPGGIILRVDTFGGIGSGVGSITIISVGSGTTIPANPLTATGGTGAGATFNVSYGVFDIVITSGGSGYITAPTITFSSGTAAATAIIGSATAGNPATPAFVQQRLMLAAQATGPNVLNMSQPGTLSNFNVSAVIQDTDAISAALTGGLFGEIKWAVPVPAGLIVFTDTITWLVTGGGAGTAITPVNITANPNSYIGSSDIQPIVINFDVLFVQSKGSIVRDTSYNFYANVYTGSDICILSSHLFYGYNIVDWAYCEEPFKLVWCVRSDGTLLSLTFIKEQEVVGWAQHSTDGLFKSTASVVEVTTEGTVDVPYFVVERTINGITKQYIERMANRIYTTDDPAQAWAVDLGIQYTGAPATTFTGAQHLAGATVTGLADGVVIPEFTMPASGTFTLAASASTVTIGLGYTAQIKTLPLDLGEPTVQGKLKQISAVSIKCDATLGLSIGRDFNSLTAMKDLVIGNVGSITNETVTGLVTGEVRTLIDPRWDVPGQYCIQQSYPLPATVLSVIPEVTIAGVQR